MRNEEIEGRIQNLEVNLQAILLRLKWLEDELSPKKEEAVKPLVPEMPAAVAGTQEIATGPPPIIAPQELKPAEEYIPWRPQFDIAEHKWQSAEESKPNAVSASVPPPQIPRAPTGQFTLPPPPSADDIEYKFGINGLLRGGAVVFVLALLFLVAIMVGRGAITPQVQIAGEIALCFSFIGIGLKKRDEREDFGQLMVGIGSFGLYASFAGGYAYKHLYQGEPLVALFTLLSLANLGFASWRSSKSFLSIGMLGGLVAAMMPMHKGNAPIDFALHFLILVPCAAIIVRNKWNGMAGLMWAVSTAALIPATTSHFEQVWRVGATYLNCAIALYACGKVFKPSDFDKHAAIQTAMLVLTGFFAIAIDTGHKGSLHAIALTAIAAGVGYSIRDNEKARNSTYLGGLIVLAIITPIGFTQSIAAFAYGVEALILISLAIRFQLVAVWAVSLATFLFSIVAYLYFPDKNIVSLARFSAPLELLLLGLLSATVALNIRYALPNKFKEIQDGAILLGGGLLVAFFVRGLNVVLGNGNTSLHIGAINTLALSISGVAALVVANRYNRIAVFCVGAITGIFACLFYLVADPDGRFSFIRVSPLMDHLILVLISVSAGLSIRFMLRRDSKESQEAVLFVAGTLLVAFFVRSMNIIWAGSLLSPSVITLVSTAVGSAIAIGIANRYPRTALYFVGTTALIAAIPFYFVPANEGAFRFANMVPALDFFFLATVATSICLNVRFVLRSGDQNEQELALFIGGSLLVAVFVRGLNIALGNGNTTLQVGDTSTLGIGLAGFAMTLIGSLTKRKGLLMASAILTVWVGVLALLCEPEVGPHWMSPVLVLLGSGCVLLGTRILSEREGEDYQETVMVFSGLILSAFFVRLMHLVGINHLLGLTKDTASNFALGLLSIVWIAFLLRNRRRANLVLSWISFIVAVCSGVSLPPNTLPFWLSPVLLAIPLGVVGVLYMLTPRKESDEGTATSLFVIVGWFLSTLFLRQELMRKWIGLNLVASYTAAWVLFAIFLITVGFKIERRFLRYWALVVFAVTVGKVFIVDLGSLDSVVRVAMLTLLGLGMMGGGYWYILWRRSQTMKPITEPSHVEDLPL
jgi:uncharacterized membrane protein